MPLTVHPIKRFLDKRKTVSLIAAAALTTGFLLTSNTAAHAQNNLLSNLGNQRAGLTNLLFSPPYQGFSTGATSVLLSSATITLETGKDTDIEVSLYDDNAGTPGTQITSLGTINISNGDGNYTISSATPISLAANTTYWLKAESLSDDRLYWIYTDASTGSTSDVGASFISSGGVNYLMGLQYQVAAAAPEPGAGALTLLGIGSIAGATRIIRRRRLNDAIPGASQGSDRT